MFDQLSEQMHGGFLIVTACDQEKILYINKAALDIFGCASKDEFTQCIKGSFREMVYTLDSEEVEQTLKEHIQDNNAHECKLIYRIRRKSGEIRWIEEYTHRVESSTMGRLCYVFLYDITERKLAEQEAKRAEEALLCEQKLNEVKNKFLFNLSHDIRTPMNAILGFAELAEKHITNTEKARTYINHVCSAGRHMLMLIDDILELSELDAKIVRISLKPVELAAVVEECLAQVQKYFDEKHITIAKNLDEGKVSVLLDVPHFQRVLFNILSNAVKFTPNDGSVTLTLHKRHTTESGFIRFALDIEDTGIGMSKEFLPKAFHAFEREKSSTHSGLIGTGIGLTVAKRIMDVMGGSITAVSEQGKGSTFTLSLPLKLADTVEIPRTPLRETEETSSKERILVVEDIEINRMLAETVLTESGFLVESVADGCDAVEAVKHAPAGYYNAILMDIQMPVMNGYEATRAIRSLGRKDLETIPIIALSANARAEDQEQSFESGMNAHVAKPFDVAGLIRTLNKYMTL